VSTPPAGAKGANSYAVASIIRSREDASAAERDRPSSGKKVK